MLATGRGGCLDRPGGTAAVRHCVPASPPAEDLRDVIHARCLPCPLPRQWQLVGALAARLAPGGWLLVDEPAYHGRLRVHSSRSPYDAEVFLRIAALLGEAMHTAQAPRPDHMRAAMLDAGLTEVRTVSFRERVTGGGSAARAHADLSLRLAAHLDAMGVTPSELERYRSLLADPALDAASFDLLRTSGRRPGRAGLANHPVPTEAQ